MSRRPTLPEPVQIATFWKNRSGDAVVVTLSTYEGRNLINVRQHFTNGEGQLRPTKQGLSMQILRLPELADAINKAVSKAKELGLIDGEATA